ncbi:hypothetical protein LCGC14_0910900 [marine sediment metagenome]|uniref:Phage terminase large subunit N-terminal domain-containing protein n=1 Tax=marine sediment metagenome TaxID=412755 RepID=A0A0F9NTT0_9ZZZZ
MGFLSIFGKHTPKYDMRRTTDWQMKDMEMTIWNEFVDYTQVPLETVQNKNRRSGKTKDSTRTAVFFDLIGLEVKWRACYRPQLTMAKQWLYMNPFVKNINNLTGAVSLYGPAYYPIDLSILTVANVTGIECDVAYFDEGAWAVKELQLYEAYRNARPMVAPSNCKHIIHFSTPARNTAFQEAWIEAELEEQRLGTKLTVLRTDVDCPWITEKWVESERIKHRDCIWYIDQNYKGIWVVYGGAVFNNFYDIHDAHVPQEIRDKWNEIPLECGGVDWNKPITKHYLVMGQVVPKYVFVKKELKFWDIDFLKDYMKYVSLELEDDDPYSNAFADTAKEKNIKCQYFGWNADAKMERVRQIQIRDVIIDKKECPTTYRNFQEASYDERYRLPFLKKLTNQHGLDGVLHMVHQIGGRIIYKKVEPMMSNMIKGWK